MEKFITVIPAKCPEKVLNALVLHSTKFDFRCRNGTERAAFVFSAGGRINK